MIDALPLLLADDGYQISRSVRLRSSASAYLTRTMTTPTSPTKWSWSGWVKRGTLPAAGSAIFAGFGAAANQDCYITFGGSSMGGSADQIGLFSPPAGNNISIFSSAVYRDPSAWYHVVVSVDTTQSTAANRVRIYVNGTEIAYSGTPTYPTASQALNINSARAHYISGNSNAVGYFDGYLTEINFIDGQALTPSSFGETDILTGVWKPKKYVGTYGTNGFFLNFSDNSGATATTIGKDSSGNGNNWTPNNISVTAGVTYDSMLDVPTPWGDGGNGRGNYAVLNPLSKQNVTISDANLGMSGTTTLAAGPTFAYPTTGKWYCEYQITTTPENGQNELIGITTDVSTPNNVVRAYASNGQYYNGSTWVTFGAAWSINDVIGVAADIDNSQISFYRNGTLQGSAQSYTFPSVASSMIRTRATGTSTFNANFGQRPFAYTPPSGFRALNTQNLPVPTILKGNQYFDATLWTGTGSAQSITNSGSMQPDLVIVKSRSYVDSNYVADSVRGSTNLLQTNATAAELNASTAITAFSSNGFSLGSSSGVNTNAATYVGWQWKEGATQGFDIVTYTGNGANRTIAHNLGVAPAFMIIKSRSAVTEWGVFFGDPTRYLLLSTTGAAVTDSTFWNNAAPNGSTFSLGTASTVNFNATTYVAYVFATVAGFSRFGSYTGNGSADGPFVFCGFRPRYILIKISSAATDGWTIQDTARAPNNVVTDILAANSSTNEATLGSSFNVDILSNGFKIRNTTSAQNTNGATYIFAAFAENPTKYALAR